MKAQLTPLANKIPEWAAGFRKSDNFAIKHAGSRATYLGSVVTSLGGAVDLVTGSVAGVFQALAQQTTDRFGWTDAASWNWSTETTGLGEDFAAKVLASGLKVINPDVNVGDMGQDGLVCTVARQVLDSAYAKASSFDNSAAKFFAKRGVVVLDVVVMTFARAADLLVAISLTIPTVALAAANTFKGFPQTKEGEEVTRLTLVGWAGAGRWVADIFRDVSKLIYAKDPQVQQTPPVTPQTPAPTPAGNSLAQSRRGGWRAYAPKWMGGHTS